MKTLYRVVRLWIRIVGLLVPEASRSRWVEEWQAEVAHALLEPSARRPRVRVTLLRVAGAPLDAWAARGVARRLGEARRGWVAGVSDEISLAARGLWRSPASSVFTVVILALGIGVNTAVFSLARSALFGALELPEAEDVVVVWERRPAQGRERNVVSFPDFADWRSLSQSFDAMAAVRFVERNLAADDRSEPVFGVRVTNDSWVSPASSPPSAAGSRQRR